MTRAVLTDPGGPSVTPSGLVVVDKPAGLTSHDVVARVRRLAGTRKVGHAGTLDPMATGVLILGVERATRLLGHLLLTDKSYEATIRLGVSTSTDDAEGEVVTTSEVTVDEGRIRAGLAAMTGEIDQVPSSVSAIKIDGKRAYQRVRAGESVALPARRVRIDSIVVTAIQGAEVTVVVRCSSGTYIRAIARDLGATLGVGGHLTALRRTAVGPFDLRDARTLDELGDHFDALAMHQAARKTFVGLDLTGDQAEDVRYGRKLDLTLPVTEPAAPPVAVFAPDGEFLALYEQRGAVAAPVAVFVG